MQSHSPLPTRQPTLSTPLPFHSLHLCTTYLPTLVRQNRRCGVIYKNEVSWNASTYWSDGMERSRKLVSLFYTWYHGLKLHWIVYSECHVLFELCNDIFVCCPSHVYQHMSNWLFGHHRTSMTTLFGGRKKSVSKKNTTSFVFEIVRETKYHVLYTPWLARCIVLYLGWKL